MAHDKEQAAVLLALKGALFDLPEDKRKKFMNAASRLARFIMELESEHEGTGVMALVFVAASMTEDDEKSEEALQDLAGITASP